VIGLYNGLAFLYSKTSFEVALAVLCTQ
jgi:hypothetical protein